MQTVFVANAFSVNMIDFGRFDVSFDEVPAETVSACLDMAARDEKARLVSAVGHADTAAVFSSMLGRDIAARRDTVKLGEGDLMWLGQYSGPRLPEGATELPDGAAIKWFQVQVFPRSA